MEGLESPRLLTVVGFLVPIFFLCHIVVYVKFLLTIKSWKHSPLHRCLGYIHNNRCQEILTKIKRAAPVELPLTKENHLRYVASSLSVSIHRVVPVNKATLAEGRLVMVFWGKEETQTICL